MKTTLPCAGGCKGFTLVLARVAYVGECVGESPDFIMLRRLSVCSLTGGFPEIADLSGAPYNKGYSVLGSTMETLQSEA